MSKIKSVEIEISPGELVDKITILKIKSEKIFDSDKLNHINYELNILNKIQSEKLIPSEELNKLTSSLKETNECLWEIEDKIRDCEAQQDFGTCFIELARSVYRENDKRAHIKLQINRILGSEIIEEKSYKSY